MRARVSSGAGRQRADSQTEAILIGSGESMICRGDGYLSSGGARFWRRVVFRGRGGANFACRVANFRRRVAYQIGGAHYFARVAVNSVRGVVWVAQKRASFPHRSDNTARVTLRQSYFTRVYRG